VNLGRVRGVVVADSRVSELRERRLVLVQPVDEDENPEGRTLVAADPLVSAAEGATVWFVSGSDATDALTEGLQPVDAAIVGLVASIRRAGRR
jgi:microcompartment protein CcmK/EutM